MSVYFIFNNEILDAEKFQEYGALVMSTLSKYEAKVIVGTSTLRIIEGTPFPRIIVVEFESEEAALRWYNTPEYQEIDAIRFESTQGWAVIAEKFELPTN